MDISNVPIIEFRLAVEASDSNIYYPTVLSGNVRLGFPLKVPTANFEVLSNNRGSTTDFVSPIRCDDVVRFQANIRYGQYARNTWITMFEGRVSELSGEFSDGSNTEQIVCLGHANEMTMAYVTSAYSQTTITTGAIADDMMAYLERITTSSNIDQTNSSSITAYDVSAYGKTIFDVIRELEELELNTYKFDVLPNYNADGTLDTLEASWQPISTTTVDYCSVMEGSKTYQSSKFKSYITKLINKVIVIGDGVSGSAEDTASQDKYGLRVKVLPDKSITSAAMCTEIATAILDRWKAPIITGSATIAGNPYAQVGTYIRVRVPSIIIDGAYIDDDFLVIGVSHNFSASGFTTSLTLGEVDISAETMLASLVVSTRRNSLNNI